MIQNTKPIYDYNSKMRKQIATPLCNQLIKYYAKQIASALIYLQANAIAPAYTLHAGNVILAKNKTICHLTGFESMFFVNDHGLLNNERFERIKRCYYIESESDDMKLKKASTDFEMKRILEVFRFGQLIIEMFTGIIDTKKVIGCLYNEQILP